MDIKIDRNSAIPSTSATMPVNDGGDSVLRDSIERNIADLSASDIESNDAVAALLEITNILLGLLSNETGSSVGSRASDMPQTINDLAEAVNGLAQSINDTSGQNSSAIAEATAESTSVQDFVTAHKQRLADIQAGASSVFDFVAGGVAVEPESGEAPVLDESSVQGFVATHKQNLQDIQDSHPSVLDYLT